MKELETTFTSRQSNARHRRRARTIRSGIAHAGVLRATTPQTSSLILFLLDLATSATDHGFLSLAKDLADQVICEWREFLADTHPCSVDASFTSDLSNCAYALAQAWKVTSEPACRETALEIIHYIGEIDPPQADAFTIFPRKGGDEGCPGSKRISAADVRSLHVVGRA